MKKNLVIMLFALLICVGIGLSAYFGSNISGSDTNWRVAITHSPSTPTSTLVPDTGWWTTITTPEK
jgi:archaellum component FlaF (FlaF/FlaG flagellin family)